MSNKTRVLVLGVSGNVSIGILKAIRDSSIDTYILGACVQRYAAGFAFCDESLLCPYANHDSFTPWLKEVIEENNINVVLSGVEEINQRLSTLEHLNERCLILVPDKKDLDTFSDKLQTINWLAENNIPYPATLDLGRDYSFEYIKQTLSLPFIVKPKSGKGSVGLFTITKESEYTSLDNKSTYVAQELVGDADSEYTCGVYKSIFGYTEIIVMRRLLRNGSTIMAEVVENQDIHDYCKKIAAACNTRSPFNIQLRLCKKTQQPLCFEVNMRLSGTTAIRHGFGFKDCQVWIKESLENKSFQHEFNVVPAVAIRYEEEVFLTKDTISSINDKQPTPMEGN